MTLKQKLLDLGIVIDNEYLDKYCELIEKHRNDEKIKYKTNRHHIIPKAYYFHNNLAIDNTKKNIVNLSIETHCWAHYYLIKCAKEQWFQGSNFTAVIFVLNLQKRKPLINYHHNLEKLIETFAPLLEKETVRGPMQGKKMTQKQKDAIIAYNHSMKGKIHLTEERKKEIAETSKDRKAIHKNGQIKYVKYYNLDPYLKDGWELGGIKRSIPKKYMTREELADITSKRNINSVWIKKDNKTKFVLKSEAQKYINEGWEHGRICNKIWIHLDNEEKQVSSSELKEYLNSGWIKGRSDLSKEKYSKAMLGISLSEETKKNISIGLRNSEKAKMANPKRSETMKNNYKKASNKFSNHTTLMYKDDETLWVKNSERKEYLLKGFDFCSRKARIKYQREVTSKC